LFAGIIAILALTSTLFLKGGSTTVDNSLLQKVNTTAPAPLKK
jgi:preprotein translocase subunit SecG